MKGNSSLREQVGILADGFQQVDIQWIKHGSEVVRKRRLYRTRSFPHLLVLLYLRSLLVIMI